MAVTTAPTNTPTSSTTNSGEYLTDRLSQEACKFIESHKEKPFFLYLANYTVHTPIQGKEELVEKYKAKPASGGHTNPAYAAMVESMDESLGNVLAKLEELALTKTPL